MAAHGQRWDLAAEAARVQLRWLLSKVVRPRALRAASPCRRWSVLGLNQPGPEVALRYLVVECLQRQHGAGLLASYEQPLGNRLLAGAAWVAAFGAVKEPKPPWQYATLGAGQ